MSRWTGIGSLAAFVMILVLATAGNALAHCDGLDGPVVSSARQALAKGDVPDHGEERVSSGHRDYDYLEWPLPPSMAPATLGHPWPSPDYGPR